MSNETNKGSICITATEFKQSLGKFLDYVCDEQNDIVITKNGVKSARLTPYISDLEQYYLVKEKAVDYSYGGKRVTYEEFMEISNNSTQRMELIDGEIYLLASPNYWHQDILGILYMGFKQFFKGKKCRAGMTPFDIKFFKPTVSDPDVLQPDLFVICDFDDKMNREGRYSGVPSLVVEILSISTRSKDMVKKLNIYMTSGVKEYWIVDPKRRSVMVYSFDGERDVDDFTLYKDTETAESRFFPGLSVSLDELFADVPSNEFVDHDSSVDKK